MVAIAVSEKETKFKEEAFNEIWYQLVDTSHEHGIPIWFLKDSKSINEGIKQIVDKLYFLISNVKPDKDIIKQFKEGKKLEKEVK